MRLRCPVVRLSSLRSSSPFYACAIASAAALLLHRAPACAQPVFTIASTSVRAGGTVDPAQVFNQDDCKGANRSPQLSWRDPPAGTRSFAVTIYDIDAPGRGWWHWAVVGIPASVSQLPENASASGFLRTLGAVEARNDFDVDGYGGPCPPAGKPHRYLITVHALNTSDLRLAQGRPALMFDHEISTTAIGSARMTVKYGR
jgi:Raf kinase inhibitor-like YbhB/YbcL family protein